MDKPKVRKVKYVGGTGCLLLMPLSDGQRSFVQGIAYTVANYDDFLRLTLNGDFVEVEDYPRVIRKVRQEDIKEDDGDSVTVKEISK